ncbi:MAG: hypothetical protein IPM57_08210 [Oligoflexia bacterium]|nr:hypothetical protein [Oligoflexia bacterium]
MIISLIIFSLFSHASIDSKEFDLEKVLAQKSVEKFSLIKKQGSSVYTDLKKIAFDEKKRLSIRWQAFMAMAKTAEKESLPEVEKAFNHQDWFLRSAALQVILILDPKKANDYSVKALKDSALVVRAQAVRNLKVLKNQNAEELLWQELYSKNNYHKNQSLWIRRYIVEALAEVATKSSEEKFIKILDDSDASLFKPAIKGLEKITGQKLGDVTLPPVYKRQLWKKWFEEKQNKS